ncbi:hypothetical protein OOK13_44745 [Streptomyces sp. NBC_00378]|uniref:hypothetical protein n=1 Tax=unclassified Streptomyces TaxID=2593676 RepID=UPI0022519504|nr:MULTISPECIES: hypothetical protein [unclassified Streptomyces]MCX5115413.1 hypothetical protein [Streptomyces sp. NBC_00378]
MIPAQHPYEANYKQEVDGRTVYRSKPVIAWDDEGQALVVDERSGRLVPANNQRTFTGLSEGGHPVIAAIAGGGWGARYNNEDGTSTVDPLVAWAVRSDGTLTPIDTDGAGLCDDPTTMGNFDGLVAPGAEARTAQLDSST